LEKEDDVLIMLPFLIGFWVLGSGEALERRYLLVQGGEILLDDGGQLVDFDRPIIE
jgi:hypothetical protein